MTATRTERQSRLVGSYQKNAGYVAPEEQRERLEALVDDLLHSDRRRLSVLLDEIVRDGTGHDWRSRVIALSMRCARGDL